MTWDLSPLLFAGAAAAATCFAHGFVRLRHRGRTDHAPWSRAVLFGAGLALAVVPLVSPLDALGDRKLLSAHMLEHVLVGDAAPAMLLVAVRGPLLFFCVPPALHALGRPLGRLLRPSVSLACWAAALAAWHVPTAYDYALTHPVVHELEHASFFAGGLLVWSQLVDPARRRRLSTAGRFAFAAVLFACGQVLGDLLVLAHPLYAAYPSASDQQAAGLVMMGEQLLTLGTFAAILAWSGLRGYWASAGNPAVRSPAPSARIANAS